MFDYTQDNLSVATSCLLCISLDSKCDDCKEVSEARQTDMAWEIVDEGNLIYQHTLSFNRKEPSGHDWTDREGEFTEPIVKIQDGGEVDNLWELDDMRQAEREQLCFWCQMLTPKMYNDCQSCDRPLERNVR